MQLTRSNEVQGKRYSCERSISICDLYEDSRACSYGPGYKLYLFLTLLCPVAGQEFAFGLIPQTPCDI